MNSARAKTVWMVSGNKGGVGKSLFCLALASELESRGLEYAVLDGDGRVGDVYSTFLRKVPARLANFRELRPESHMCRQDEVYESMVHELLAASPNLVINTPDGADSTLMRWFDVTLMHTESNNCLFKVMYLLSDRPDGLNLLPELANRFAYLYPVRNRHFGSEEVFNVFNRDYAHMFRDVLDFPVLRADEVRILFDRRSYPGEILRLKNADGLYVFQTLIRARFRSWLSAVSELMDYVIENVDSGNVISRPKVGI